MRYKRRFGRRRPVSPTAWSFSQTEAMEFVPPEAFPTTAELLRLPARIPEVVVRPLALLKMFILVSAIDIEVGWLGTAQEKGLTITVDDVFLFHQDVSGGHSLITTEAMSQAMQEALQRPDGEYIFNNTRFWGHSHGSGTPYPSGQDDDQMIEFEESGAKFFLRGIFNRRGDINFSVFDWRRNMAFHRVPWQVVGRPISVAAAATIRDELRAEMKAKVVYRLPQPVQRTYVYVAARPQTIVVQPAGATVPVNDQSVAAVTDENGGNGTPRAVHWGAWEFFSYLMGKQHEGA